ncbi:hypothetical protein R3W88_000947 [Solanum pinnatisectum]|uniref:Uncharacterized protein n=1 Tax=Solanum pinnatisectum TaxID=50273 RepID=A0AAV9MJR7_9SOLN|nr:hypothetical protein R3W88_000947 [Solanum pinnatisectum]
MVRVFMKVPISLWRSLKSFLSKKFWVLRAPNPWANTHEKLENLDSSKKGLANAEMGVKNWCEHTWRLPTHYGGSHKVF